MKTNSAYLACVLLLVVCGSVQSQSYYKHDQALFSTRPSETQSLTNIKRLGPIGIGIDLIQPAFTMRISHIEDGSPAAQSGNLKPGQIIEKINGKQLNSIDPRIQLGQWLTKAEASDGIVRFKIRGQLEESIVNIPVLGTYSATWPLNCPKSEKIVRNFATYLSQPDAPKGFGGIGMLFLLSTGEEKDLETVRAWAREVAEKPQTYAWYLGYGGIPLCEYYLRTGDEAVRAGIQNWVNNAVKAQYLDGWAGRGGVPRVTYGNGHLNAGGTAVLTFLLLAKECGADVPEHALQGALTHFYRYSGRGHNPYGDDRPETGFVDNGKNGNLAFAMAAAAALTPDGENSVYAQARDACAMTSFYTTSFMLHGHTGGGIGESWRSPAMGLLYEKRPKQYRQFMESRKWHYELSRRFDGSFGILGGAGYDDEKWQGGWGTAYALTYTIPRKTLRITGAPPTKFSKPFRLPPQPWGVEADNAFLSLDAATEVNGRRQDVTLETLAEHSSRAIIHRLHHSGEVSDDLIRKYVHHQDHNIRYVAAHKAIGINSGYIGRRSNGGNVRHHLVAEFMSSHDPRVRRAVYAAIYDTLRYGKTAAFNESVFRGAMQAVADPNESWWVKDAALRLIGHAPTNWVQPHVETLLPYLKHEDWWLQNATLIALHSVVADDLSYEKVLPPIGELIRSNQRSALTLGLMNSLRDKIKSGSPDVHRLAAATLKKSFTGYAGVKTAQGGQDISSTFESHLEQIAASFADVPGGLEVLYEIARERYPQEILPFKEYFLQADPADFGPELKKAIHPIITEELIPEFVGRNWKTLQQLAEGEIQSGYPGGSRDKIDGLVALYRRSGNHNFNWQMFADLRTATWAYHSFDPIEEEQIPFDQLITRYRDVTLTGGKENWFKKGYDASGWKTGRSPFGQYNGTLPQQPILKCNENCQGPACFGATPINTLWEKEILLMRGRFEVPPLETGYRYRLRINDGNHVGSGGGHIVYINGKELIEAKTCNGRGSGGLPKGAYISQDFINDFEKGDVTIAVKTFLRFNDKYKVKPSDSISQGKISVHLEKQLIPPMGDDLLLKSATVVPMLSSDWQAAQDPADRERKSSAVKFIYDGLFENNPLVLGKWQTLGVVKSVEDFSPDQRLNPRSAKFGSMNFLAKSKLGDPTLIWSGDKLLDLTRYEALKMKTKTVDNQIYLFIESGGFNPSHPADWRSTWQVFKR